MIILFLIRVILSCQKEVLQPLEIQTINNLVTEYNLNKNSNLKEENSIVFTSTAEAAKFIEEVRNSGPIQILTNTNTKNTQKKQWRERI